MTLLTVKKYKKVIIINKLAKQLILKEVMLLIIYRHKLLKITLNQLLVLKHQV